MKSHLDHIFLVEGAGKVTVSDLDPNKCSVYIYAFATLNPSTYEIEAADPALDINQKVSYVITKVLFREMPQLT